MDKEKQSSSHGEEDKPQPPTAASKQEHNPPEEASHHTSHPRPPQNIEHKPSYAWLKNMYDRISNNWDKVLSLLIQGVLAFFTYQLWGQATTQSKAAIKAADAAIKADSIYIATLKWDSTKNAQASVSDSLKYVKRFNLDSTSFQGQIKTMKGTLGETKNEFAIENRPYLQITHPRMDTFAIGRPMKIKYNIENLGGYPAKILAYKEYANGNTQPTTDQEIKRVDEELNKFDSSRFLLNRYIIRGTPLEVEYADTAGFTEAQYKLVKTTKQIMYFVGYFRYQNLITKQERIYKYRIEIECKLGGFADFKYNENDDVSKKDAKRVIPLENWK